MFSFFPVYLSISLRISVSPFTSAQSFADFMTPVELLAMLIAALCHDLQHPGTNNVLQINACSDLAIRWVWVCECSCVGLVDECRELVW